MTKTHKGISINGIRKKKKYVKDEFFLTLKQLKTLKELLKLHKLDIDPVDLLSFIKSAIELREKAKFFLLKISQNALN